MKTTGLIVRVPTAGERPTVWESLDIVELSDFQTAWIAGAWAEMEHARCTTYIETLMKTLQGMAKEE